MSVKLNVSALTRLATTERKAAEKAAAGVGDVVAINAMKLARIARVEAPLSDGSRGAEQHLRETIDWAMLTEGSGFAHAWIGPDGEYGEEVGRFVEFGTRRHIIRPRPDGPGYLAWPGRARIDPRPKEWGSSVEYSGDESGQLQFVRHPGGEADPFMGRSLAAVAPKFQKDIEALAKKSL